MGDIDTWRGMISGIPVRVDIDAADLIAFGNVINRYLDWCRMAGRDY